eukprot:gene23355-28265_t
MLVLAKPLDRMLVLAKPLDCMLVLANPLDRMLVFAKPLDRMLVLANPLDRMLSFGATWAELGETALTLGKCETEGANALLNGRGGGLGMTLSHLGTSLEALAEPSQEECTNMVLGMKVPIKEYLAEIQ